VRVMSSTLCTLGRVQDLDAVASTICTSAWCDGASRGLGCVTWLVRPGTSPPRATVSGVEKSSRLVG
jgi:hypothetical protein